MNANIRLSTWLVVLTLGWLPLSSSAQAASFDCTTAQSKVEKMVCDNPELSKLDDELAQTYKTALQDKGKTEAVKKAQKLWLNGRNACGDVACIQQSYQDRITAIASSVQSAQGMEALYGKWENHNGNGVVARTIEIFKSKITWKDSNSNPRCTVSYELVPEAAVMKFKVVPNHFQHISPFKSYVLAIHGACALQIAYFRLTLPDNLSGYMDMIEYSDNFAEAVGYLHFHKH